MRRRRSTVTQCNSFWSLAKTKLPRKGGGWQPMWCLKPGTLVNCLPTAAIPDTHFSIKCSAPCDSGSFNGLIDARRQDPVSGSSPLRSYRCRVEREAAFDIQRRPWEGFRPFRVIALHKEAVVPVVSQASPRDLCPHPAQCSRLPAPSTA